MVEYVEKTLILGPRWFTKSNGYAPLININASKSNINIWLTGNTALSFFRPLVKAPLESCPIVRAVLCISFV